METTAPPRPEQVPAPLWDQLNHILNGYGPAADLALLQAKYPVQAEARGPLDRLLTAEAIPQGFVIQAIQSARDDIAAYLQILGGCDVAPVDKGDDNRCLRSWRAALPESISPDRGWAHIKLNIRAYQAYGHITIGAREVLTWQVEAASCHPDDAYPCLSKWTAKTHPSDGSKRWANETSVRRTARGVIFRCGPRTSELFGRDLGLRVQDYPAFRADSQQPGAIAHPRYRRHNWENFRRFTRLNEVLKSA